MQCSKIYLPITILLFSVAVLSSCNSNRAPTLPSATHETGALPYILAPGDTLEVFVWGNPQLTTEVTIRPDGKITIPLVEDLQASGKTPYTIAREIEDLLVKFVVEPVVSVKVNGFVGRYSEQIRIVGQAASPQAIPYSENITLLDVMIAVGGITEFADGNKATIVREESGEQREYQVRLDDLLNNGDISANVDLLPGDILIIPEAWF